MMPRIKLLALMLCLTAVPALAQQETPNEPKSEASVEEKKQLLSYSAMLEAAKLNRIEKAVVWDEGWWVSGTLTSGREFETRSNPNTQSAKHLADLGVEVRIAHYAEEKEPPEWLDVVPGVLLILFFLALIPIIAITNNRYYKRAEEINQEFLARLDEVLSKHVS